MERQQAKLPSRVRSELQDLLAAGLTRDALAKATVLKSCALRLIDESPPVDPESAVVALLLFATCVDKPTTGDLDATYAAMAAARMAFLLEDPSPGDLERARESAWTNDIKKNKKDTVYPQPSSVLVTEVSVRKSLAMIAWKTYGGATGAQTARIFRGEWQTRTQDALCQAIARVVASPETSGPQIKALLPEAERRRAVFNPKAATTADDDPPPPTKRNAFRLSLRHSARGGAVGLVAVLALVGAVVWGLSAEKESPETTAAADLQVAVDPQYRTETSGGYYIPGKRSRDFNDLPDSSLPGSVGWDEWVSRHDPVKDVTGLAIVFSSSTADRVVIEDVNVVVTDRREMTGDMIGDYEGDPGRETVFYTVAQLGGDPVQLVTEKVPGVADDPDGRIEREPFDPPYSVTNDEVMRFDLDIDAQGYDCDWYAEVTYAVDGEFRTIRLPEDPSETYRSVWVRWTALAG